MTVGLTYQNIRQRIYYISIIFINEILNNMTPDYLYEKTTINKNLRKYPTTSINIIKLPIQRKVCSQNNFFYKELKYYNKLPKSIKNLLIHNTKRFTLLVVSCPCRTPLPNYSPSISLVNTHGLMKLFFTALITFNFVEMIFSIIRF